VKMASSFSDMTLREFVDALASGDPTPGGGSAAAVAGAMGAALLSMVAGLTSASTLSDDKAEEMRRIRIRSCELAYALLEAADADTAAFNGVMAAYRMPKDSEDQKATRRQAIQAALRVAVEAPRNTCTLAQQALERAEFVAEYGNPNAASDGAVGALLLDAAMGGGAFNIRINLSSIKDSEYVSRMRAFADEADGFRHAASKAALDAARKRIEGQ
jgi:formiminotetrahydrofolate cyclodeaminase